jgi:protocatechuate 3,4-dioxygenase beta subunit
MDHPQPASSRRRGLLALFAGSAALLLAGRARAQALARPFACVVTPAQTEGPYFVDERLNRADIRSDPADATLRPGVPLALMLRVTDGSACTPLAGATVDIWHCDADGVYSDAGDLHFDTRGRRFLRGYRVTEPDGSARFTTIYPGWYPGRAVHIHFKVRAVAASGKPVEFTSQLYFNEAFTDRMHAREPYARRGPHRLRNEEDGIYRRGGNRLVLYPVETPQGCTASFDIALRMG